MEILGNLAGAGAIMTLCDDIYLKKSVQMAKKIRVVDLVDDQDFQDIFIKKLSFPV